MMYGLGEAIGNAMMTAFCVGFSTGVMLAVLVPWLWTHIDVSVTWR
jgi:hypothetical protein